MLHFPAEAFPPSQPAFIFTAYSLGYFISFAACVLIGLAAWTRRSVNGSSLLLLMIISAGLWSFFGIFESSATALETKIIFSKLEYLVGQPLPVLLFLFSIYHAGLKRYLKPTATILLFLIPVATILLAFSNQYHGLVWSSFSPGPTGSNLIIYGHGFWYWIGVIGYSGLCIFISSALLIGFSVTSHRIFRGRLMMVIAGALLPWIAVLVYSSPLNPLPGYDLGRIVIPVSVALFLLAITRGRLLELVPIQRSLVFESIRDGVMILDNQDTIIDVNQEAAAL